MIINSINLHNFMSYADARLDLSLIDVACLSGANGAGKSALLDAITWAVWEEARAASDELIRLGQKEMWVDVVFTQEGNTYRIRRTRQKMPSRSGTKLNTKGSLDLQMLALGREERHTDIYSSEHLPTHLDSNNGTDKGGDNGDHRTSDYREGNWVSLTAASIKETEQKISELLKMDYQTFVNSAYLKQGAADQFARKPPGERKQILAEILGLSSFEQLQDRCREKLKPLKEKCQWLGDLLANLPEIEGQVEQLQREKFNLSGRLDDARAEKEKLEEEINLWQKRQHEVNARQEQEKNIRSQLLVVADEIDMLSGQKESLCKRLHQLQETAAQQCEGANQLADYEQTVLAIKQLDEKSLLAQNLEKQKSNLGARLSQERTRLEVELKQLEKEADELLDRKTKLLADVKAQDSIVNEFRHYQNLVDKEAELARKQEAYTQIKQRTGELQTVVDEAQIRLDVEIDQKTEQLNKLRLLADTQSLLERQKQDLEAKELELEKKEQEFQFVADKGLEVKAQLENIARQIMDGGKTKEEYERKIEELNKASDSSICPLCSAVIVDRAAVIKRYEDIIAQSGCEALALENERNKLEKQRNDLRAKYSQLNNELVQRKELDKQIGQFKEKARAIKESQESQTRLAEEIAVLVEQKEKNDFACVEQASLIRLNKELHEMQFDPALYAGIQAQIRSQRGIEARYNQLQRDLAELSKVENAFPELNRNIESLKAMLAAEGYGSTIRDAIRDLDGQLHEINYDQAQHCRLKDKLENLLPSIEKNKDITRALHEIPLLEKNILDSEKWQAEKGSQRDNLTSELQSITADLDQPTQIEAEIVRCKSALKDSQGNYESLLQEQAKIMAQLERSRNEIEELAEKKAQLEENRLALDEFSFLAECFGKKGIQAIIIENAIPEIEADANRILSRLTDSRMHVTLSTQQKNKSGNIAETLDIEISDDLGQRSYELYSGGEAFKVNFAIRVALSRLLARRAGAKLETLIIDEGFGSQDDHSRDKLVKAIRSIQPDFARILVITHFSDVKEMFPTHIQISKHSGTSQIELVN